MHPDARCQAGPYNSPRKAPSGSEKTVKASGELGFVPLGDDVISQTDRQGGAGSNRKEMSSLWIF